MAQEFAFIDLKALQAASIFASTEETRYYLNGVCLEIEPHAITYIATDGHRMFAIKRLAFNVDNTLLGTFIIPTASCTAFKLKKGDAPKATMARADGGKLSFEHGDALHHFGPIDGTFPAWRTVIPQVPEAPAKAIAIQWHYMADFANAAELVNAGQPVLFPAEDGSPSIIRFSNNQVIGVVMGLRIRTPPETAIPDWAKPPTVEEPTAEAAE